LSGRHSDSGFVFQWGVAAGTWLMLSTEFLSISGHLDILGIIAAWLAFAGLGLRRWYSLRATRGLRREPSAPPTAEVALVAAGALLLCVLLAVALFSPPNTFDSLTYRLPRVVMWAQHGSVDHYLTSVDRQLFMAPLADYAILHLWLLAGGDRLAGLPQFLALLVATLAAAGVASQLGGGRTAALVAGICVLTLPMALLQATSTQNDLMAAAWLLAFLYFLLAEVRPASGSGLWAGAALGLLLLTKQTGWIFAAPFIVAGAIGATAAARRRLATAVAVALVLAAPMLLRNVATFGRPLGPRAPNYVVQNEAISARGMASNVLRMAASHLADLGPSAAPVVERAARRAVATFADPDDARFTFPARPFGLVNRFGGDDETRGNPLHLLAGLAAMLALVVRPAPRPTRALVAATVAAFLLFALTVKWQAWITRLDLPLFGLLAVFTGLAAARLGRRVALALAFVLLAAAVPVVAWNDVRPALGEWSVFRRARDELRFIGAAELREPVARAAAAVAATPCDTVGLRTGGNDRVYLLQSALLERRPYRFEYDDGGRHCVLVTFANGRPQVDQAAGASGR
jgi:hypothetical protein